MLEVIISGCALVGLGAAAYWGPHAARLRQERQLRFSCIASRSLVLTYDDGPGPTLTPRLLDLLAAQGAPATFFVLGRKAADHPQLVDRIRAEGHEIGCHSSQHLHPWKAWPWQVLADIRGGFESLAPWVAPNGLFRPPHGKLSAVNWLALRRRGASLAWWTIDSGDTSSVLPQPQSVADAVARAGGAVVLMHDFDRKVQERSDFVLRVTEALLRMARSESMSVRRYGDLCAAPRAAGVTCSA